MNLTVRAKNPWFWVTLGGVILASMGISPEMFTSWGAVWEAIKALVSNPYMLGCVILAVLGVFIDPTTKGVGDSSQALTYTKPKEE
ncbi:MAG: phage holin [Bacteroidaceae bacterium]|nr:phage holin [Bacteroidaceae bacterium]